MDKIVIRGAREHNLKNIHLEIPRDKLVVITGLSGSGKSSLAFDTIYAEGQRRYIESLSTYARQFLDLMEKPDVDYISGLSPAIAIQQRTPSHNPRSTVGTVTEIYDYLRLLYARIGIPHCPQCGKKILPQSSQQIIDELSGLPNDTKIQILAPLVKGRTGTYSELFNRLQSNGYVRVRVDGKTYDLEENIQLDRYKKHEIDVVVDRITIADNVRERLSDSVETALKESRGLLKAIIGNTEKIFSEHHACPECAISIPEIEPRTFSFNSPFGACPECDGLGTKFEVDPALVIPDPALSIDQGAIRPWSNPITTRTHRWKSSWEGYYEGMLSDLCRKNHIPVNKPFKTLTQEQKKLIFYGQDEFEGVITNLSRRYKETESDYVKEEIYNKYITRKICPLCRGTRLKKETLGITISNKSIAEISSMSIDKAAEFFSKLELSEKEKVIAKQIFKEINQRLKFLIDVGLNYITLERETQTLAGGEAQRIHLATRIGSGLTGVLYVLDEPTIGLHQKDNKRLLDTLLKLRDLGNTLIVVEHDKDTIEASDWIVDLGPGAGIHGGKVIANGPLETILKEKESLTGQYLNGKLRISVPKERRNPSGKAIKITGASQFNLKHIDVSIPIGLLTCITGVSGSGKSTLVYEILYKALAQKFYQSKEAPGKFNSIKGTENIDKIIIVDQSPIGRTPRSNAATYTGVFGPIRDIFSRLPEAKRRGFGPGRFSFNVKGGRCENCQGDGTIKIEMQFLPDVYVKCEVCKGARFNEETLRVRFKGKNIAELLDMPVEEALGFFKNIPQIARTLQTLNDVGLGYIKIGQSAPALSGGEAQRVKLATELSKRATGKTLYILDEPTTGLHFADVEKLLNVLHKLADLKNTVVIIEHNLEVIKTADWIIDLGPDGGNAGGEITAEGTPEDIVKNKKSYTGQYLKEYISK
ncbi:MAG: excinuclease ABC subunit UvrA [Elusimicrobia bacterium]|nr:excinuclease ABC subunit UvrA [Elusimicrobiota bacterium]MBU2614619.1 excinuclease ABC subunit UvrA [Elusimicrobiota bacterium]